MKNFFYLVVSLLGLSVLFWIWFCVFVYLEVI